MADIARFKAPGPIFLDRKTTLWKHVIFCFSGKKSSGLQFPLYQQEYQHRDEGLTRPVILSTLTYER
jgi:hypothetical protein